MTVALDLAAPPGWDVVVVPTFGGGLNFAGHPGSIRDDEWTGCNGWFAKDGYAEIRTAYEEVKATGWLPISGAETARVIGIAQNPFSSVDAALIGTAYLSGSALPWRLWKLRDDGTLTEITFGTDTQGGATTPTGNRAGYMPAAFLDGYLCLSGGHPSDGYSMIRWNDGATFQTIKPVGFSRFVAQHLASFGGHLIAADGSNGTTSDRGRAVFVSDADSTDVWAPAVGNSADDFALDDAIASLTAVGPLTNNGFALYTRGVTYVLQPTGGIPPFTRQTLQARGVLERQNVGLTPYGPFIRSSDDFYIGATPVGRKIWRYYRKLKEMDALAVPEFKYHERDGAVLVMARSETATADLLLFDPVNGAWSRTLLPSVGSGWIRHGFLYDNNSGNASYDLGRHWIAAIDGTIYAEAFTATTPHSGAFVNTKFFHYEDPTRDNYYGRIKVDWEPLTNATTDAIEILAEVRNDLSQAVLGSVGGDIPGTFTSLGTLTGGASELAMRKRGKYIRFRFQHSSGRARIRGFALLRRRGSSRRT